MGNVGSPFGYDLGPWIKQERRLRRRTMSHVVYWEIPTQEVEGTRDFLAALFGWTRKPESDDDVMLSAEEGIGGGIQTAQYPLAIYAKWFRRFFTFVVPLACLNYFPSLAITGGYDPLGTPAWVPWISPAVGVLFLLLTLRVWHFGVSHYRSTGT